MPTCLIALGSNVGDRRQTLDRALELLDQVPQVEVRAHSRWHETRPVGGPAGQQPFLNGAALLETALGPEAVLALLQTLEEQLGRHRQQHWGPRTLDLDLLLYDQLVLETPDLTLPHPRMAWRRFVLEPAAEIAAEMQHPGTGWAISRLLHHLNTAAPYVAITGPIGGGKSELAQRVAETAPGRFIAEPVDIASLEKFYADPAGNAWETEIEFLQARVRLLSSDRPEWTARDRLAVSDFWLGQSLAYARVWLPAEEFAAFEDRWRKSSQGTVPAKLVVVLDAPTEELVRRIQHRGRPGEDRLTPDILDRLREAVFREVCQPNRGPVLRLKQPTPEQALEEVVAAVEAMEG